MLDTNVASRIVRGDHRGLLGRLASEPLEAVTVSVVTRAELLYGAAKRGNPVGLSRRLRAFLERATVLSWTPDTADVYAELRASIEAAGLSLAPLDLMIAAHARAEHATLVSADKAFAKLGNRISLEDWTKGA